MYSISGRITVCALSVLTLWGTAPAAGQGDSTGALPARSTASATTIFACYVPGPGVIYRIKEPGLLTQCLKGHIEFSWSVGGSVFDHGALAGLGNDDHPQYLLANGSRALTGPLSLGGFKITGLAAGEAAGEAVRFEQAVKSGDAAGGDLAGTFPNPTVAQLQGTALSGTAPAAGNVLTFNGTAWAPAAPAGGGTSSDLQCAGCVDGSDLARDGSGNFNAGQLISTQLRVEGTGGFAATGAFDPFSLTADPLVSGEGVRMLWYPEKAAFRAGFVIGNQWDRINVGIISTALGEGTTAIGHVATAMGSGTTASGGVATAMGFRTTASGDIATAMGSGTTAQAFGSLVIGQYNVVAGSTDSWVATDPLLVAGNGTSQAARSDALTLYKNGNLTIAGTLTQASDIRLKEDVQPIPSVLDRVLQLTPIRYRFRAGTGHPTEPKLGLSAQEVEELFPELVSRDAQGYLSVAYSDLSAVLVRALQEQQATIERLLATVTTLEQQLRQLEGTK